MNKKNFILTLIILIFITINVLVIASLITKNNYINDKQNETCNNDSRYCIYKYNKKDYLVLNKGYDKEYNIQYFNINDKDIKNTKNYSIIDYTEYENFCKKYNIERIYNNKSLNYLLYFNYAKIADSIDAKLGDIEYKDDKVILYIWEKVNYFGGVSIDDGTSKAYLIIVPTDKKKYKI